SPEARYRPSAWAPPNASFFVYAVTKDSPPRLHENGRTPERRLGRQNGSQTPGVYKRLSGSARNFPEPPSPVCGTYLSRSESDLGPQADDRIADRVLEDGLRQSAEAGRHVAVPAEQLA